MGCINLGEVLVKEAVVLDHDPFKDKDEMFDFLAGKLNSAGVATDKEAYKKALYEREEMGPTYMGNFIGLPHGKCDEVIKPGIAFCRCKEPFTYQSCGEEGKVKYVFMLAIAGTQSGDEYMRVLATLAGLLAHEEFLAVLETCTSYEDLLDKINEFNK